MSKISRSIGDRLLAMFLPNDTAGACVPDNGKVVYPGCGCTDRHYYRKTCTITCTGSMTCGPCQRTQNLC